MLKEMIKQNVYDKYKEVIIGIVSVSKQEQFKC